MSHSSRSSHRSGRGSSSKHELPGCEHGAAKCGVDPGGCMMPTTKELKKLHPQLKVDGKWILPYAEPDPAEDPEGHRRWRRDFPKWKDTIKCTCGKGYFCREHALWVRGHEAKDKYQRELDQYGYPNCPQWHHDDPELQGTGDRVPTVDEAGEYDEVDDSTGLGQDFGNLNLDPVSRGPYGADSPSDGSFSGYGRDASSYTLYGHQGQHQEAQRHEAGPSDSSYLPARDYSGGNRGTSGGFGSKDPFYYDGPGEQQVYQQDYQQDYQTDAYQETQASGSGRRDQDQRRRR
ncbi:hypothetical protein QBC34DRAFT_413638 [Podospora aff. communis PSN243]|uniref:Uncharacterized protein n=1 Tax=Podospora aff. communis PSN243 TaxID=3040156 RepID=A0AAV9G9V2_9PEZI|nr:hypothetical protein QBC34DRAFT_413638 [Podospora aff. communis PSN243]